MTALPPPPADGPRSHPNCWTVTGYVHACHEPSGRTCLGCDQPAGTPWGPLWCPSCDVVRLDRVAVGIRQILKEFDRE